MFLFHDKAPVNFKDDLPEAVDVVIIGAGIIGISTAWYLLDQGMSVLVCEKGRVAGEQSSRNWGWVRVTFRDPPEVSIALESQRCWEGMAAALGEELGFVRQGLIALAETEQELADFECWMDVAREHDMDTRMLTASEARELIHVPFNRWRGGLITPGDCRAEPFKAVPAIARGVQARGGRIRESCAVRTVEQQAGRVSTVHTEHGRVRTQAVVCSAGAWSSMFLANLGVRLPQLTVRATVARTAPAPSIFEGTALLKDVFLRRRLDGGYTTTTAFTEHFIGAGSFRYFWDFRASSPSTTEVKLRLGGDVTQRGFFASSWRGDQISPFERHRVLNPEPSKFAVEKIRRHLRKRVPHLAEIPFQQSWAGMIDATPDIVPVMDEIPDLPGLFVATGFSGHGFGIGPGAGRVMADLVSGRGTDHDLHRFRFSRFSDGSKIVPGPAI